MLSLPKKFEACFVLNQNDFLIVNKLNNTFFFPPTSSEAIPNN